MSEVLLDLEKREKVGKQSSKQLRRAGKVPGIYYTHGQESIPVVIDGKQLYTAIHTEASIIDLNFDSGDKAKCVIRDIQWHPVSDNPIHVDLLGIKMTEKVHVEVPIHLVGNPVGVKQEGGVLDQIMREISIECLPADIPEHLEIDITNLEIGDSVKIEVLTIEKVRILSDPSQAIAVVRPPRVVAEEEEAVEEELAEPEVVGEKKADSEEEEAQESNQ